MFPLVRNVTFKKCQAYFEPHCIINYYFVITSLFLSIKVRYKVNGLA